MKKITIITLLLTIILSISACGNDNNNQNEVENINEITEEIQMTNVPSKVSDEIEECVLPKVDVETSPIMFDFRNSQIGRHFNLSFEEKATFYTIAFESTKLDDIDADIYVTCTINDDVLPRTSSVEKIHVVESIWTDLKYKFEYFDESNSVSENGWLFYYVENSKENTPINFQYKDSGATYGELIFKFDASQNPEMVAKGYITGWIRSDQKYIDRFYKKYMLDINDPFFDTYNYMQNIYFVNKEDESDKVFATVADVNMFIYKAKHFFTTYDEMVDFFDKEGFEPIIAN